MDAATLILSLVSGVVGAVLGGVITGWYTMRAAVVTFQLDRDAAQQDRQTQQYEQAQRVRDLLKFEKDQYLAAFRAYWDVVAEGQSPTGTNTLVEFERRLRLVRTQLPDWDHLMWRTQADTLTTAVPDGGELQRLYEFHANLDAFAGRRQELIDFLTSDPYKSLLSVYDGAKRDQHNALIKQQPYDIEAPFRNALVHEYIDRTARIWGTCADLSTKITLETPQLLEKPLPSPLPAAETAEGRGGSVMHIFDRIRHRSTS